MLPTGTFPHCCWLPTQAGRGIRLIPWEKHFLLMQCNIYVLHGVVCITTASESNFLEVRAAVDPSGGAGVPPGQGWDPGGVSSSPCTSRISYLAFFSLFKKKIPGGSCVPSSGKHLLHQEAGKGRRAPRGVCHPKALPGVVPSC